MTASWTVNSAYKLTAAAFTWYAGDVLLSSFLKYEFDRWPILTHRTFSKFNIAIGLLS